MKVLYIRFLLALHFFALGGFSSSGESKDKLFYDAVRTEASGDVNKAIEIYSQITEQGNSASLHANLANLYFKTEDYGRSVLHFRKAILIDPPNRNYAANLSLVYEMAGGATEDLKEIHSSFSAHYKPLGWSVLQLSSGLVSFISQLLSAYHLKVISPFFLFQSGSAYVSFWVGDFSNPKDSPINYNAK